MDAHQNEVGTPGKLGDGGTISFDRAFEANTPIRLLCDGDSHGIMVLPFPSAPTSYPDGATLKNYAKNRTCNRAGDAIAHHTTGYPAFRSFSRHCRPPGILKAVW